VPHLEGSGWLYPEMVPYSWERLNGIVEEGGLVARRLDWEHPRQSWFVAALPGAEDDIADLSLIGFGVQFDTREPTKSKVSSPRYRAQFTGAGDRSANRLVPPSSTRQRLANRLTLTTRTRPRRARGSRSPSR
jgi:hypothetical protein